MRKIAKIFPELQCLKLRESYTLEEGDGLLHPNVTAVSLNTDIRWSRFKKHCLRSFPNLSIVYTDADASEVEGEGGWNSSERKIMVHDYSGSICSM